MSDTAKLVVIGLLVLASMVYAFFLMLWAVECGNAGGAFIIPQNSFPVCVQGVR